MPQWYDPLFALLAAQPAATSRVTITLGEVVARGGAPIPDAAYARSYWSRPVHGPLRRRLRVAGWRVAGVREGVNPALTFVRLPPATSG